MASVAFSPVDPTEQSAQPSKNPGRWWLILTCVGVGAAAFPGLRLELGGLLIPLHIVPLLCAIPGALPRFRRVPQNIRLAGGVFFALFAAAVLQFGSQFGDLVKMGTSVLTIIVIASLVRTKDDFLAGVLALALACLVINARGLNAGSTGNFGYQPMQGIGNKNSYSLYALPFVLLAGFALLHFRMARLSAVVLIACILSSAFLLFTGANRSGWAGIIVIAAFLAIQARRWRALFVVAALGLGSYGALVLLGTTEVFEFRVAQTSGGYESDDLRQSLLLEAIEIGIENPVLGVSIQQLPYELAKRTAFQGEGVDPHNFIGYIVGGCGVLCFGALCLLGLVLLRRPRPNLSQYELLAHDLVRMIVVVFAFRGLFSREVFFIAAFPIALGLAMGLMLAANGTTWNLTTERA